MRKVRESYVYIQLDSALREISDSWLVRTMEFSSKYDVIQYDFLEPCKTDEIILI